MWPLLPGQRRTRFPATLLGGEPHNHAVKREFSSACYVSSSCPKAFPSRRDCPCHSRPHLPSATTSSNWFMSLISGFGCSRRSRIAALAWGGARWSSGRYRGRAGGGCRVATGPVGGRGRVNWPRPARHRLASQVGAAQFAASGQAVVRGQDRDARLNQQDFGVQAVLVGWGPQYRDVGGSAAQAGGWPAAVAEQDAHLGHPRILRAPLRDLSEQVRAAACLDGDGETVRLGFPAAGALDCGARLSTTIRPCSSTAPARVSVTRLLERSSSRTPTLRSSLPMAADSGGWAMPKRDHVQSWKPGLACPDC
jgi:hypothetical protein